MRRLFTALAAFVALGCQGDDDASDEELAQAVPCEPSIDGGVTEPSVDGAVGEGADAGASDAGPRRGAPFFTSIKASGNGCPAGSWRTELSADGSQFEAYFDQFFAKLAEGERTLARDCNLRISLRSPAGLSYALTELVMTGSVDLDEDVTAEQTARYFFQGVASSAQKEARTPFKGPISNERYAFVDKVDAIDAAWSPCGTDRLFNINTRLYVESRSGGRGAISLSGLKSLKLAWRTCK